MNHLGLGFGSPSILKKDLTVSSPGLSNFTRYSIYFNAFLGKNVRWSTNLVEEQLFSSKPSNTVTSPVGSLNPFAMAPSVASVGSKGVF